MKPAPSGERSLHRRRFSLQFDGINVRVIFREQRIERVTVDRRSVKNPSRTSLEAGLIEYFRGRLRGERGIDWDRLRLDSTTEFRRAVYGAVAEVPAGTTVSYGELADRIGKEGAARAVGQALRANPVPLVVPCHRVIRADGRPGGYAGRGTSSLKRHLLGLEDRWTDRD